MSVPVPSAPALEERKAALRRSLLARRRASSVAERAAGSLALSAALTADPLWGSARGIAAFVGVRREVDTLPLLRRCLGEGRALWLPRVLGGGEMRFWRVADLTALENLDRGAMGLLEPAELGPGLAAPGPEQGIDLVLVPGLGFDRSGARIGFGKGHYDRAFGPRFRAREAGPNPCLVGCCLQPFLVASPIPTEDHDLSMHALATDLGVLRCPGEAEG